MLVISTLTATCLISAWESSVSASESRTITNGIRKTAKELRKAPKTLDFLNIVINAAF